MFRGLAQITFLFLVSVTVIACGGGRKGGGGGGGGSASSSSDEQQKLSKYEECVSAIATLIEPLGVPDRAIGILLSGQASVIYEQGNYYENTDTLNHKLTYKFNTDKDTGTEEGFVSFVLPGLDSIAYLKSENCEQDVAIQDMYSGSIFLTFASAEHYIQPSFTSIGNPGSLSWFSTKSKLVLIFRFGDYIIVVNNADY